MLSEPKSSLVGFLEMEISLLRDMAVIFVLSAAVLFIFHKMRAPAIVGFLVTGILAEPYGFGLISSSDQVSVLADIGVILLLFTIGLEVSLKDLLKIKKYVLVGGSLQVALTIFVVFAIFEVSGLAHRNICHSWVSRIPK